MQYCVCYQGEALDTDHLSELTEEEYEVNFVKPHLKGFMKIDVKYLIPFLTRRFTQQVHTSIASETTQNLRHHRKLRLYRNMNIYGPLIGSSNSFVIRFLCYVWCMQHIFTKHILKVI